MSTEQHAVTLARAELPFLFWALLILVLLLPLPLGAVDTWSWGLMASLVGALLVIWGGGVATGRQVPTYGLRSLWPILLLFFLAVAWAWLQTRPLLPSSWAHPLWELASVALGWTLPATVSLDPYATLSALVRLLAYGGVFWIAFQFGRRNARARAAVVWLSYAGMAYAVYGIIVYFLGLDVILIFRKTAYLNDLTSTFVNRNSYATYAGLGLICCTGLLMVVVTQAVAAPSTVQESALRVLEAIVERGWPLVLGWLALLLALVLTHSRAGFFSTLVALLTFLVAAGMTRAVNRRLAIGIGAGCVAVLALFLVVNGEHILKRLVETSMAEEERPLVYDRVIDAIGDAGMLGTGYGTFEQVFRFYRTPEIGGTFTKAHSVYLENTLELGVPASLALVGVIGGLAALCVFGVRQRRRDAVYPCIGLAATVLIALHSVVDFSMQIPAVAATYAFIMGIACAQCWSSRRPDDPW
jgi:O-antigen ligase